MWNINENILEHKLLYKFKFYFLKEMFLLSLFLIDIILCNRICLHLFAFLLKA